MRAMFANLTRNDFGGRPNRETRTTRTTERLRVHVLFDEIQIAIHRGDEARVNRLMARLAAATTTPRLPVELATDAIRRHADGGQIRHG
jgi:hypothetical protein